MIRTTTERPFRMFSAREQPVFDSRTLPQPASRRKLSMMESPHNNHEFRFWLWWAPVRRRPAFLRRVAAAICLACWPNFDMLGPLLLKQMRQDPDPPPGLAASDDPSSLAGSAGPPRAGGSRRSSGRSRRWHGCLRPKGSHRDAQEGRTIILI